MVSTSRAVAGYDDIRREVESFLTPMTSFDAEILNLAVADNVVLTERVDHINYKGRMLHARIMGAFEIAGDKISNRTHRAA